MECQLILLKMSRRGADEQVPLTLEYLKKVRF